MGSTLPNSGAVLTHDPPLGRRWRTLALALLALALVYFAARGPYRAWSATIDYHVFYAASRAWAQGSDPYDQTNLDRVFMQADGRIPIGVDPHTGRVNRFGTPTRDASVNLSLNPPMTFVPLAPLALLPWRISENLWTLINMAAIALTALALLRTLNVPVTATAALFFLAALLALAPLHTSLVQGQLTILVAAAVAGALWADTRGRWILSGVLLALAACLKPQLGLAFLLLPFVRMRWASGLVAVGAVGLLAAVAVGRMELAGIDWLASYRANLSGFVTQGGQADPTAANSRAFMMINLGALLSQVFASSTLANAMSLGLLAAAGLAAVVLMHRRGKARDEMLMYSAVAVLSLLAFYNRSYGATLLVVPLAWAVLAIGQPALRKPALLALLCVIVFLVPGSAALAVLQQKDLFNPDAAWWRMGVLWHQTYALLVLTGAILWAMVRQRRSHPADAPPLTMRPA